MNDELIDLVLLVLGSALVGAHFGSILLGVGVFLISASNRTWG